MLELLGVEVTNKDKSILDYELCPHEAGEKCSEVVHIEIVPEIRGIYMEYE